MMSKQSLISGQWRSKAILKALEGVKRDEIFMNLRRANNSNTVSQKFAVLNAAPNVQNMGPDRLKFDHRRSNSLVQTINLGQDLMKPPSLKQLRMEII